MSWTTERPSLREILKLWATTNARARYAKVRSKCARITKPTMKLSKRTTNTTITACDFSWVSSVGRLISRTLKKPSQDHRLTGETTTTKYEIESTDDHHISSVATAIGTLYAAWVYMKALSKHTIFFCLVSCVVIVMNVRQCSPHNGEPLVVSRRLALRISTAKPEPAANSSLSFSTHRPKCV